MQFKQVKIRKTWLKDFITLLRKLDLVHNNRAFCEYVYISEHDHKIIRKNLKTAYRKKYPFLKASRIESSVGMEDLNYGPCMGLNKAIKPGWAVIVPVHEMKLDEESTK